MLRSRQTLSQAVQVSSLGKWGYRANHSQNFEGRRGRSMEKAKPCPFCGQELLSKDLGDGEIEFYHNMDCIFPPITTITPTEFIKDWNKRFDGFKDK